jgi:site-specific recombinase XerD
VARIDAVIESQKLLNYQQVEIVKGQHEMREDASELTNRVDYMEEKVDKMDHLTEAVLRLGIAVEKSNDAIEKSNAENKVTLNKVLEILTKHEVRMDDHANEIENLKLAPAKKALGLQDVIKGIFTTTFIGGVALLLWDRLITIWKP